MKIMDSWLEININRKFDYGEKIQDLQISYRGYKGEFVTYTFPSDYIITNFSNKIELDNSVAPGYDLFIKEMLSSLRNNTIIQIVVSGHLSSKKSTKVNIKLNNTLDIEIYNLIPKI